jgi:hypothetical protein
MFDDERLLVFRRVWKRLHELGGTGIEGAALTNHYLGYQACHDNRRICLCKALHHP